MKSHQATAARDHAVMVKFFRLFGLDGERLSDHELEDRRRLTAHHPAAWIEAVRLGPYHPSEPEFTPGFSKPPTVH